MGPAFAGFSITLIGVHWSMCTVFVCSIFALLALSQIDKKPIMNHKNRRACDAEFEGIKFVFNNKTVLELLL
jgi:hypothetical protein